MRYRNIENSRESSKQVVDINSLRRKGETSFKFQINKQKQSELLISNLPNMYLFLAAAASLIYSQRQTLSKTKSKIFTDFTIQNVPKQYQNFQHQKTLQQIIVLLKNYCKTLAELEQAIKEYPIFEFAIYCYGRSVVKKYIRERIQKQAYKFQKPIKSIANSVSVIANRGQNQNTPLSSQHQELKAQFHGNQYEIIENYEAQIRGSILQCLCNALQIQMTIFLKDLAGEQFIQNYGNISNPLKIDIKQGQDQQTCQIYYEKMIPKLGEYSSTQQLIRSKKQLEHFDSTTEDLTAKTRTESKSVNKDPIGRCKTCGSRTRFCQCERKNGVTPRAAGLQKNGIFDNIGLQTFVKNTRKQDNKKKCHCNRVNCVCRR